jgi:hypothetical protein
MNNKIYNILIINQLIINNRWQGFNLANGILYVLQSKIVLSFIFDASHRSKICSNALHCLLIKPNTLMFKTKFEFPK